MVDTCTYLNIYPEPVCQELDREFYIRLIGYKYGLTLNKIKNLLGPPQFYKVSYTHTDRATIRGPGGPKNTFECFRYLILHAASAGNGS